MTTLIPILLILPARAPEPLVTERLIEASVAEVWRAWTTTEGIKSWMVAEGDIDLKVGGLMRTGYQAGTDLAGPNAIHNTIIAYDPERMLAIRVSRAPEKFPFKKAISEVWTVIYLSPVSPKQTQVTVRMLGYRDDEEHNKMREFFAYGNKVTLDALEKRFAR